MGDSFDQKYQKSNKSTKTRMIVIPRTTPFDNYDLFSEIDTADTAPLQLPMTSSKFPNFAFFRVYR